MTFTVITTIHEELILEMEAQLVEEITEGHITDFKP